MNGIALIPIEKDLPYRLNQLRNLDDMTKWERAAIVFAYTNTGKLVQPPKLNISQFANQGYAKLKSVKSVQRYRRAWEYAISQGWAKPTYAGGVIALPRKPFPSWQKFLTAPEYRR